MSVHPSVDKLNSAWKANKAIALAITEYVKPKVTVDLGIEEGYSTFLFATPGYGTVYGLDQFIKPVWEQIAYSVRDEIQDDIAPVVFVSGLFSDTAKTWDKEIDILHIDGSHDLDSVREDYNTWVPFLAENGVVLMHDLFLPGPMTVFQESDMHKFKFDVDWKTGILSRDSDLISYLVEHF